MAARIPAEVAFEGTTVTLHTFSQLEAMKKIKPEPVGPAR